MLILCKICLVTKLFCSEQQYLNMVFSHCSIEKPTQFTWKLRLKSIQLTEAGNYSCFVYTTRQNRKEANMTVAVLGRFID